ncbi:long-chain acyl-CoA synthetase [Mariprofundus micogutta]|uniref:Long-chain acyl-CoA synthetase n=1 Tax=Mariprofundus micogutta TaxID=1921010 RepID=A0A1L8CKM2_9PROT|nr:long-chain fatty acid--CoA ligase [Mariprofundus micogutta]GAV19457.1 long-chain acyl-CoA synthetase [Mariprofundus micogutta]
MTSDKQFCSGFQQARQAGCLSDLLLASPAEWLDKPLLRYRSSDGEWNSWSRIKVQQAVLRLAAWLEFKGVRPGDRVGILGHNCPEWFIADFAILRLGAVTVPAYFTDPPEAVQYVLDDAGVSLVFVEEGDQLHKLDGVDVERLPFHGDAESISTITCDEQWDNALKASCPDRSQLATLIYTSGTTGFPKGVMLTHDNILSDVAAGIGGVPVFEDDLFLSFLPASHAFERTVGHFLPAACGSQIAYAEAITTLLRDMPEVSPTIMISVPRLYEKIYAGVQAKLAAGPGLKRKLFNLAQKLGMERFELRQQGSDLAGGKALLWKILDGVVNAKLREKMGGNIRGFISGGAALHPDIARFLLAADIMVLPGYGLTETSPVLSVNRMENIKPATVGAALPGVEFKLARDGELLVKGPMVMQGYWKRPEETAEVFDADGWLCTGDIVEMDDDGFITIVDRKKEIMVLSNGENVPPATVEQHLNQDPCFLQSMVIADNRPYVSALIVPDGAGLAAVWQQEKFAVLPDDWRQNSEVTAWVLQRMRHDEHDLSSFMQVKRFAFVDEEWTQDSGLLTPTLKLKRRKICEVHHALIESLYPEAVEE